MAEKGKIKNLKSKLEGNKLDLSLSELTVVPASKDINNLKKVTEIDLSRNRLQFLNDDFCLISNLTWLDLSSNGLKALPEQFGKLSTLQHLDLYQNNLSNLPLSFGQLKQLRWLDLKDNPLNDRLRAEAGECLEPKECKQAAHKVVQYIQKLQSDHERDLQKRLKTEKDAETARKALENQERRPKEKKKKEKKKNAMHQENSKRSDTANHRDSTSDTSEHEVQVKRPKRYSQRASKSLAGRCCSCLWFICKSIFYTLLLLSVTVVALTAFMYVNCTRHKEILPKSHPLCQDIYLFLTTGQKSMTWDYAATIAELRTNANDALTHGLESVKNVDVDAWKTTFVEWNLVAREKVVRFVSYVYKHGGEFASSAWEILKIWFAIVWECTIQIVRRLFDLSVHVCQWLAEVSRDFMDNYPTYWEKAKYYWKNLK